MKRMVFGVLAPVVLVCQMVSGGVQIGGDFQRADANNLRGS